jgi:hypothetical protein
MNMVTLAPPLSSTERQRLFRLRHPGYDARRKARERAGAKRSAAASPLLAAFHAAFRGEATSEATRPALMLPAPVEDLAMADVNALAASLASARVAKPVAR